MFFIDVSCASWGTQADQRILVLMCVGSAGAIIPAVKTVVVLPMGRRCWTSVETAWIPPTQISTQVRHKTGS